MTVRINHAPQIDGLTVQWVETMTRIDDALDRGDRRAFRMWSMKACSLSARLSSLLVKIATAEAT